MFLIKRKKPLLNLLFKATVFFALGINLGKATDSGDVVFHLVGSWNQDLKVFQTRVNAGYAFWNDFSIGPVVEVNKYFYAPGLGVTWHLEPFEVLAAAGPLFWHKDDVKKTAIQVSVHANYLKQITTHFQILISAGVNLPDKFFRGVPVGLGVRYWF
jgi:hypothetical protein